MCKHAETFNANKGYDLTIAFFYQLRGFQYRNLRYPFATFLARK